MHVGYSKDLLILAFDHRGSFLEKLFGIKGRQPTIEEVKEVSRYKRIVYEGFKLALQQGVPREKAGLLIDEQFGEQIALDARRQQLTFAMSVEKSGQDEFDFEYGEQFGKHIERFSPTFSKVLVRYNVEGDAALNQRQVGTLKELNDWLHANHRMFLFELLVPATKQQLEGVGGDKGKYDLQVRPKLMVHAMAELQQKGIAPDVWKLEGLEKKEDVEAVVKQARANGTDAGVVVLGRGESAEKVREWLSVGATIPGVIGFAVGRTIFWEALQGLKEGKWDGEKARQMVADNYKAFSDLWLQARGT